jgi:DNA mismatch endonuclease, patch repair protein
MKISKETRSRMMKSIKSKNTGLELFVRRELWKRGYRYRVNYKKLPGTPDIVFTKAKLVIFCDGDFWHGRFFSEESFLNSENSDFWRKKISRNIQRDKEVDKKLENLGYIVLRFWESDIYDNIDYYISLIEGYLIIG